MLPSLTLLTLLTTSFVSADWTWPNPVLDEIEDITHVQRGLFRSGIVEGLSPCNLAKDDDSDESESLKSPPDLLRTGFHDAINYDIQQGTGGVDASLMWETNRPENRGASAFNDTFELMSKYHNTRASMSDLIALATYTAVRHCGGPGLVMRAGRIDATGPGPEGSVPEPKDRVETMISKFENAGFNKVDMIQMVACGHTIGGVHRRDFPEITGRSGKKDLHDFDRTGSKFDNRVATEYLDGTTRNPLVLAPGGNNSDFKVFNSDGNSTIKAMSEPPAFLSTCGSILQRMIDTVPSTVKLSDPITPMKVKPRNLQLQLSSTGKLQLDGYIRVRSDNKRSSRRPIVKLVYADRDGQVSSKNIITQPVLSEGGMGTGFEASFWFYQIEPTILSNGISHFNVSVTSNTGAETIYDNNGNGYPIQDKIIFQSAQSCLAPKADANGNQSMTVTAAVRDGLGLAIPSFNVVVKTYRDQSHVPSLDVQTTPMKLLRSTKYGYTLYSGTYALPRYSRSTTVDVWVEGPNGVKYEDAFKKTDDFKAKCQGTY